MRDHAGMMRGTDGMRDSLAIEGLPNIKTFICLTIKFLCIKISQIYPSIKQWDWESLLKKRHRVAPVIVCKIVYHD